MLHLRRLTALGILFLAACTMTDELEPDPPHERSAELEGAVYEITTASELTREQLHAIAQFVEAQGEDVQQAKVGVRLDEDAGTTLELELHGAALPGAELMEALRQEFPILGDAHMEILEAGEPSPSLEMAAGVEPGDDPETIEQKIVADLRAKGVEGEIDVTVTPLGDDHHEIEVHVEDHAAHE